MGFKGVINEVRAVGARVGDTEPVLVYRRGNGKLHSSRKCSRIKRIQTDVLVMTVAEIADTRDDDWCQACPDISGPWQNLYKASREMRDATNQAAELSWSLLAEQAQAARLAEVAATPNISSELYAQASALATEARQRCVALTEVIDPVIRVRQAALLSVGPRYSWADAAPGVTSKALLPQQVIKGKGRRVTIRPNRTYHVTWSRFVTDAFKGVDLEVAASAAVAAGLAANEKVGLQGAPLALAAELADITAGWVQAVLAAEDFSMVTVFITFPDKLGPEGLELFAGFPSSPTRDDAIFANVPAGVAKVIGRHAWLTNSRVKRVTDTAVSLDVLEFAARLFDSTEKDSKLSDPTEVIAVAAQLVAA